MNTIPRRDQPPMPKVTNLPGAPAPQARPNRNTEQVFAEQALRSAQHVIDQATEIDRIGEELESWRRRALMAEADIVRLEKRENELRDMLDRRQTELIDERDSFRMKLNNMMAQFHTAGAVILKCIEAGQGTVASPVSLTKLADEIDGDIGSEEALPRTVTAGPRED